MPGGCRRALLGMQQGAQIEPRRYPDKLDHGTGAS